MYPRSKVIGFIIASLAHLAAIGECSMDVNFDSKDENMKS